MVTKRKKLIEESSNSNTRGLNESNWVNQKNAKGYEIHLKIYE